MALEIPRFIFPAPFPRGSDSAQEIAVKYGMSENIFIVDGRVLLDLDFLLSYCKLDPLGLGFCILFRYMRGDTTRQQFSTEEKRDFWFDELRERISFSEEFRKIARRAEGRGEQTLGYHRTG